MRRRTPAATGRRDGDARRCGDSEQSGIRRSALRLLPGRSSRRYRLGMPWQQSEPEHRLPTAADVDAAARRLAGVALHTPLISSPVLDALTGARVFLKAETLQRTGSFKFRGAYNKLSSIPPDERAGGVVAFSSGNHAQGVAARREAARHAGGHRDAVGRAAAEARAHRGVRRRGRALRSRAAKTARRIARALAEKRGATLVPPYDDPFIIAGPGHGRPRDHRGPGRARPHARRGGDRRLGRRACRRHRARASRRARRRRKIYTAEPAGLRRSRRARSAAASARTTRALTGSICDALMSNTPGKITFEINRELIGEGDRGERRGSRPRRRLRVPRAEAGGRAGRRDRRSRRCSPAGST